MVNSDDILAKWVKLGAKLSIAPAKNTPDIEHLIISTAEIIPHFIQLEPIVVAWLKCFEDMVCRHRLAAMAKEISLPETSAILGFLLSHAKKITGTSHLAMAINECKPLITPQALHEVDRQNRQLAQLAQQCSSDMAVDWGLWAQEERVPDGAIMPASWVMNNNPTLQYRAVFGGKLQASIIATLLSNPRAGKSELSLARACYATRKAVHEALGHLELCQIIERNQGKGLATIVLAKKFVYGYSVI